MNPAIVIPAFNRSRMLGRLLATLLQARYPDGEIPLVISIDRGIAGHDNQVRRVAEEVNWPYGEKRMVLQPNRLGLVKHVEWCSALSKEYGSIVLLEDDLYVSPAYYMFTAQALAAYQDDPCIAGVSLYALWFNGYTHQPFVPLPDETDVYFLQIPYTQGQAFTGSQWQRFEDWLAQGDRQITTQDNIHDMFRHFDAEDWFPLRTKYLIESGLFYVYPRQSLSTCFGDPGTHFTRPSTFLQASLQRFQSDFRLKPLEESAAVYDSFFEILPNRLSRLARGLNGLSFDVDLYATKRPGNLRSGLVLTTRGCRSPQMTFDMALWPLEANVIDGMSGEGISLCKVDDLKWGWLGDLAARKRTHDFFTRRRRPGKRDWVLFWLLDVAETLGLYKG